MLKPCRLLQHLLTLLCLFHFALVSVAQSPEPQIHERLSNATRSVLPGSASPLARFGSDLGALPADQTLRGLTLVLKRSPSQQADLEALLAAQADPHSPQYHHWLTPDAFAARFGVAPSDVAVAQSWLVSQGFLVQESSANRDRIAFDGTAAQVASAFGTELHRYTVAGEDHFGPSTDLHMPSALLPAILAVLHLSDVHPKPHAHPVPQYTDSTSGQHFLTPPDLAVMYNINPGSSNPLNGDSQSIAIAGESYVDLGGFSEVATFAFNTHLGNSINGYSILVPGSGVEAAVPGALAEGQLDLEYANGIAPRATMYYIYVGDNSNYDAFDALDFAVQQNVAPVVSVSYGLCESLISSAALTAFEGVLMQAASQGQTIVTASGDSGSTGCARFTSSGLSTLQEDALAVEYPASSPWVTAVGGTQMAAGTFASGANTYWSGLSVTPSLLTYVPESTWNEDSTANGLFASGGGASTLLPRPAWQSSVSTLPAGTTRLIPDLALQASGLDPGFLVCTDDISFLGPGVQGCSLGFLNSRQTYTVAGGTSFAAPVLAGAVALLNQYEQEQGQGLINPALYQLASDPITYATVFHDITSGTIACTLGVSNCTPAGQAGYNAAPGFDLATGWGSFDFSQLRTAWPQNPSYDAHRQATGTSISYNNASGLGSNTGLAPGSPFSAQIDVGSESVNGGTTPTGTVSIFLDGVALENSVPLTAGPAVANATIPMVHGTAPASTGSHLLRATYSGDTDHLPSTAIYPFLVGAVTASGAVNLSAPNLSLGNNTSGSNLITVTPTGGYHGEITWTIAATVSGAKTGSTACYSITPLHVSGPTTATISLGAGTVCGAPLPSANPISNARPQTLAQVSAQPRLLEVVPALAFCFCFMGKRFRRGRAVCGAILPLLLFVAGVSGCGSKPAQSSSVTSTGSGSSSTPAITPTVYTIGVTAKDSVNPFILASTSFTLTVN